MFFVEKFSKEKQWKDFTGHYFNVTESFKKGQVIFGSAVSDEDIWPFIIPAMLKCSALPIVVLTATSERADELSREIKALGGTDCIFIYPALGSGIYKKSRAISQESLSQRLEILKTVSQYQDAKEPFIIFATSNSIIDLFPKEGIAGARSIEFKKGQKIDREMLINSLIEIGYERVNRVYDRGEFSARGDIFDIFDITSANPYRLDILQDDIEKIFAYDIQDQKILLNIEKLKVFPKIDIFDGTNKDSKSNKTSLMGYLKSCIGKFGVVLCDPVEVELKLKSDLDLVYRSYEPDASEGQDKDFFITDKKAREEYLKSNFLAHDYLGGSEIKETGFYLELISSGIEDPKTAASFYFADIARQKRSYGNSEIFIANLKKDIKASKEILISMDSTDRIKKISQVLLDSGISLKNHFSTEQNKLADGDLAGGSFQPLLQEPVKGAANLYNMALLSGYESAKISVYGELDIFEQLEATFDTARLLPAEKTGEDFEPGDFVVHRTHGIGRYIDVISDQVNGNKREYFLIEYADGDKLYVPTWQSDRIHKYIGDKAPSISALNSKQWENLKNRVRSSVQRLAVDLASLYALRNSAQGFAFEPDKSWQKEMEDLFPFMETSDQIKAINYVKELMEIPKPMDLLVCGDVGFGKTEVALRAAFKAIENSKQVLMLVPTTILADQHFRTFSERYKNFPVVVEVISRFRTTAEQKAIINNFMDGRIDMLIGTHRLLSEDIKPKDLGLIIIDEEQRFGVNAKEKIKLYKKEVDVLTLTATPIPRTLYMSLTGIRDIVQIDTHPAGRFPIETFVGERNDFVIRMAIEREIRRGGQVYYVHNRISDIQEKQYRLSVLVPGARIALTHGRMDGKEIEKVMQDFLEKKYDILLTTSIIESGMDISNVNTLIVDDSHRFGLSQLYQIRGRVGRSSEKAYAYFFYPDRRILNLTAFQRLKTLAEYTELGSGYKVAMKDLEIRGAGDLLGAKQHGNINSVGFDMYCHIIKEEIEKLKGVQSEPDINVQIELPFSSYIPKNYIKNEKERVSLYRSLGKLKDQAEASRIVENIEERYGKIPDVLLNLINIARIKLAAKSAGVEQVLFSKVKGVYFRKINLGSDKAAGLSLKDPALVYMPKTREIIVKNSEKNLTLGLVFDSLCSLAKLN